MSDLLLNLQTRDRNPELMEDYDQSIKLKCLFLNCSLKKSNMPSNTRLLIHKLEVLMGQRNCDTECCTIADYNCSYGTSIDKEDKDDEFPLIYEKIKESDIVVVCSPIWFGVRSAPCQLLLERLIGGFSDTDDNGRPVGYGKVGGVIITGNEDGAHDVAANTLYNLTHLGFLVPPNSDCYWVGDAGPGPSYNEAEGAKENYYTNRTAEIMSFNLPFYSRLIKTNENPVHFLNLEAKAKGNSKMPNYTTKSDFAEKYKKLKNKPTDRELIEKGKEPNNYDLF